MPQWAQPPEGDNPAGASSGWKEAFVGAPYSVEATHPLVERSEEIDQVFLVDSGWVCAERRVSGRRVIVDLYLPGDVIGIERVFVDAAAHRLVALTRLRYRTASSTSLRELVRRNPDAMRRFARRVADERQRIEAHALDLCRVLATDRVVAVLAALHRRIASAPPQGGTESDGESFLIPLPREYLADYLGLNLIHLNRAIRRLSADGLLALTSEGVVMFPQKLRAWQLRTHFPCHRDRGGARPS